MPLARKVECDMECGAEETEKNHGDGFIGWYVLVGLQKHNADVTICPKCAEEVKAFVMTRAAENAALKIIS